MKLITAAFALLGGNVGFANELIDCTGCAPAYFQLAAMDPLDGVHIVYDLKTGVSRKFDVQGVDCNLRPESTSVDGKKIPPQMNCSSGNATVKEMPVDVGMVSILADMTIFDAQFPGYIQNGYAKDFEINLDSPPVGFSDPPTGGNFAGHHDIVGIALDRNFSNPVQNDVRFRNFEAAIARWLSSSNVPPELEGFRSLASRITGFSIQVPTGHGDAGTSLSWNPSEYKIKVVAKDGFGNQIHMSFNPKNGELTIEQIVSNTGNPFPSKYENGAFTTSFFQDRNAGETYAGLLENAGVPVAYGRPPSNPRGTGGGGGRWWQVTCVRVGEGPMTCYFYAE